MPETEYTGPGLSLNAELMEIIQAGMDFADLQKSSGYQRLMAFLKGRAEAALKNMRVVPFGDDKTRLAALLEWQFCEDIIGDIESHMQQAMKESQETIKNLNVNELAREGLVMRFGNEVENE